MAEIIITSYFTNNGVPVTGLTPTVRIWEVNATGQNLIIGSTKGSHDPGPIGGGSTGGTIGEDGQMIEVEDDDGDGDGFFKYVFATINGYDPKKCYAFRVDGGAGQTDEERYQVGELNTTDNADAMVDLIYDEPSIDHISSGTFGEMFNQISATNNKLLMDVMDVQELIELAIKYSANKTKIDHVNKTMIIYDIDCVTPLRTFQLLDKDGNPSITDMSERVPIASGTSDGKPTCA